MKGRNLNVVKRLLTVGGVAIAWLGISRLLAVWMSNHYFMIHGPVRALATCLHDYDYGYDVMTNPGSCKITGLQYGNGIYPEPRPGMPHSAFFGTVYTDGWGWLGALFVGIVAMVLIYFAACLLYLLVDGILHGFSAEADPCNVGACDCECKCCRRRKKSHEQRKSSNWSWWFAFGTLLGITIGS